MGLGGGRTQGARDQATGARWSWPSSSQASQVASGAMRARARVRRQRGAPSRAQPGAGARCQRVSMPGAPPAPGVRRSASGAAPRRQRPGLGGEVQPADGGERRGLGQVGHHQRHLAGAQRLLGGPEGSRRACGCGRRRGGRDRGRRGCRRRSAARRTRPGCSQSTGPASRAAARSAKTARAGPAASCARARAERDAGREDEVGSAAGAWRVWSMVFAGCSQELRRRRAIKLRRGCAPSARRTPRR